MQCWKDDWYNPMLQHWAWHLNSSTMILEYCMAACYVRDSTYKYFGIENGYDPYGVECWFGSSVRLTPGRVLR
jgi:hypothetical protein